MVGQYDINFQTRAQHLQRFCARVRLDRRVAEIGGGGRHGGEARAGVEPQPADDAAHIARELAAADSNLAHSLRNHYAGIENALLDPTPSSPRLLALAADGLLFGGAAQKQSGSSGPASEGKVDRVGDDEYLVSCRRYYATGSLYADYLTV